MSTDFYSFSVRRFGIYPKADGSAVIVISGTAADSSTPAGGKLELKVNGEPVRFRLRHDRHSGFENIDKIPEEIESPRFILRAVVPAMTLKEVSLSFNDKETKTWNEQETAKATNDSGFETRIDISQPNEAKDILNIMGWVIGWDTDEDITVEALDGDNKKIENLEIYYQPRWDVERAYFTLSETVTGFNINILDYPNVKGPVTLRVTDGTHTKQISSKVPKSMLRRIVTLNSDTLSRSLDYLRANGVRPLFSKIARKVTHKDDPANDEYNQWFLAHRTTPEELEWQRNHPLKKQPLVSLIVAAFNTPIDLLEKMIDSVREQTYTNWELCIADGSTNDSVRTWLEAHPDPKIKWCSLDKNYGISGNMNAAADLATGEYIALYDHDDFLEPDTLYRVMKEFEDHDYDFVYTDEDKYEDASGRYVGPNFKPDFSPALLRSTNYICHFLTIKRDIYDKAGGKLYSEFDGAQDYDLVLRLMDVTKPERVGHVPRILYHWRMCAGSTALTADSKLWAYRAGERAIEAWAKRNGIDAKVIGSNVPGQQRLRYATPGNPMISVIIPSKDHINDLELCVEGLCTGMKYRNFEVIIIDNNSTEPETFEGYKTLQSLFDNVKVLSWNHPFNYSAINNFGVKHAKGEYLLFLNNDTEPQSNDLLNEMLGQAMLPNVGAVGAMLFYENTTIQHDGVIIGHSGIAGHAFIGRYEGLENYLERLVRNVSAATAACLMVPRHVFEEVGGFNEDLAVAYNDIDLCLKIRKAGYQIVQDPFARMYHYESRTRGYEDSPEKKARFESEVRHMYSLWPDELRSEDPYYSPNYDITGITYQLRKDDEVNPYINPDFLGEAYYTAGTLRPKRPEAKAEKTAANAKGAEDQKTEE